jgi:pyridoxine 4-dehydrogenase
MSNQQIGSADLRSDGHGPATIRLGDLEVCRLGYGAMQLPGPGVWGPPKDPARARTVLRRVIELGINLIDTSWYYGPHVSNELIAEVLHPYPKGLVIACKLGSKRTPDKGWAPFIRPDELRQGCEEDLRTLKLERLDVVHLRWMNVGVPFLEALDAMIDLQKQGKIRHIALSNVNAAQIEQALARTPIVSVQNSFNIARGQGALEKMAHAEVENPDAVVDLCAEKGIAFMPFFPLAGSSLAEPPAALARAAKKHGVTPAQIVIAWLLARSPTMLPIPGTSSVGHLEENWAARSIALDAAEIAAISG